jgi:hypothetical protein
MSYRVCVPRQNYRGRDPRKLAKLREDNHLCALIEAELQSRYDNIQPGQIQSIMSYDVARAIGHSHDAEKVRRIIFRLDAGANGVTFSKEPRPGETWEHFREPDREPGPSAPATSDGQLPLGARARHKKFGCGTITHIEADRLEIAFDEAGSKRVLQTFVEPE